MAEQKDQNEKTRKLGERQFNMWRKEEEKSQGVRCKGNNSWPPTIGPVAMPPSPTKKSPLFSFYSRHFMSWNILAGQSVLGVQVVLSPSFLPTGGAEPEERRPWCCARTAQQWPELLCYQHSSSHTQNPGCSEGSYLHPSQTPYIAKCTWKHKGQLLYLNFGEGPH